MPLTTEEMQGAALFEMDKARELTFESRPRLLAGLQKVARRAGVLHPEFYVTEQDYLNAVHVSGRKIIVTSEVLKLLNDEEATAYIAHEFGHIANAKKEKLYACKNTLVPLAGGLLGVIGAEISDSDRPKHLGKDAWRLKITRRQLMRSIVGAGAGAVTGAGLTPLLHDPLRDEYNADWAGMELYPNKQATLSMYAKVSSWKRAHGQVDSDGVDHPGDTNRLRRAEQFFDQRGR